MHYQIIKYRIMKKKIILSLTACLFAAGSVMNMHFAQNSHGMDVSLADISVMAQANPESGGGLECDCVQCPSSEYGCWSYDYSIGWTYENEGYEGSASCDGFGAGWIEQNVLNVDPDACN
jgi:hypothetical protein